MTEQIELPLCPFCGSRAEFEYDDSDEGTGRCGCVSPLCGIRFNDSRDEAIRLWCGRVTE